MSDFNKDDYLKDLPDVDSLNGDSTSGKAGEAAHQNAPNQSAGDGGKKATADDSTQSDQSTKPAESAQSSQSQQPKADGTQADAKADAKSADNADGKDDKSEKAAADNADADKNSDGSLTPLGQAKKEAAEYLEALQRERAEFINYRNRMNKERENSRQYGIIDVLTALLPALDDIDRIREHGEMDDSFKAVAAKIDKTFAKFGVEKFGEKGEDFDPNKHEAVLQKPDPEAKKETVDTVVEAGYRIGDRVVRAARVVVSMPQS